MKYTLRRIKNWSTWGKNYGFFFLSYGVRETEKICCNLFSKFKAIELGRGISFILEARIIGNCIFGELWALSGLCEHVYDTRFNLTGTVHRYIYATWRRIPAVHTGYFSKRNKCNTYIYFFLLFNDIDARVEGGIDRARG